MNLKPNDILDFIVVFLFIEDFDGLGGILVVPFMTLSCNAIKSKTYSKGVRKGMILLVCRNWVLSICQNMNLTNFQLPLPIFQIHRKKNTLTRYLGRAKDILLLVCIGSIHSKHGIPSVFQISLLAMCRIGNLAIFFYPCQFVGNHRKEDFLCLPFHTRKKSFTFLNPTLHTRIN